MACDAQAPADRLLDITSDNPSERIDDQHIRLVNGYDIDPSMLQHLRGGVLVTESGLRTFEPMPA
jgi:hypothetical protein